jgi:hypothetical protein
MSDECGETPFQAPLLLPLITVFETVLISFQSGTRRWLAVDSFVKAAAFGFQVGLKSVVEEKNVE